MCVLLSVGPQTAKRLDFWYVPLLEIELKNGPTNAHNRRGNRLGRR